MKLLRITMLIIGFSVLLAAGEVINPDKPANGTWDFKMEKVWTIDAYNKDIIASPNQLRVADNGNVYIHDGKNKRYYIFSPEGKFIKAFGKKGEGPGEIKMIEQARIIPIKNNLVIADQDKIHYFSGDGEYIRSVRNTYFRRRPSLFIDEDRFISAPMLIIPGRDKDGAKIKLVDLKSDEETVIAKFEAFKKGSAQQSGMVIAIIVGGLTPMMTIGYNDGLLYWGMNDNYQINVTDLQGKKHLSFGIDRDVKTISDKEKMAQLKDEGGVPQEMMDKLRKQLPNRMTFFQRIQEYKNHIYVTVASLGDDGNPKFDIFSKDGKYLYQAEIKLAEGDIVASGPVFKDGYLYLALESEDGEFAINKYKVQVPKS
jgi:6-bladed beta-propeller